MNRKEAEPVLEDLAVGTMMVREELLLPTLDIETDAYSARWRSVRDLGSAGLGHTLDAAGWHLFFIAGRIDSLAVGRARDKTLKKVIDRIGVKVSALNFNCLQLSEITRKHFLGVPYTAISAHAFHIQQGRQLKRKRPVRILSRVE